MAEKFERLALATFILFFIAKALYLAFSIGENIFPDEITWFGKSVYFSKFFLFPQNSPASYPLGLVTHSPSFYVFLMGKILHANIFPVSDLIFLRCINIIFGSLTIFNGWRLLNILKTDMVNRLLFLAIIGNTLMFTFLSAAVNYDNLNNLLAVLSLFYLVSFFQSGKVRSFLLAFFFLLLGCLTKTSFLPYGFLLVVVTIFHERKNLINCFSSFLTLLTSKDWQRIILTLLCLLLLWTNLNLYLCNWLRFGYLVPSVDQVVGLEAALQNRVFARGHILEKFKRDKITFRQAIQMTSIIKHEGDRLGAIYLLQQAAKEKSQPNPYRINRFNYSFQWFELMAGKIFGIMGHISMEKSSAALIPYYLMFILFLIGFIRTIHWMDLQGYGKYLAFIVIGYALILMQLVNYKSYYYSGVIVLALQGRYIFPVIIPFYILIATYMLAPFPKRVQWVISATVTVFFIYGEFPWFLSNVTSGWFF